MKGKNLFHIPSISFDNGADIWPESGDYEKLSRSFKRLSSRALLMAEASEPVVVDKPPDPSYLSLLKTCGAGGRPVVPSSSEADCLSDDAGASPEVVDLIKEWDGGFEIYMPSGAENRLSEICGVSITKTSHRATSLLNDKVFFTRLIEDLGLPMIDTWLGNSNAVAAKIRKKPDAAVVVRGAASVGGSQVFVGVTGDDKARLLKTLDKMTGKSLILLQPYIPHETSPNLQFYITDDQIHLLGRTVQIFDRRLGHCGNYFDSTGDDKIDMALLEQGRAIVTEAAALGYRGVAGVDFIVTADGGAYPVELNARHNTSTHALWFLNRFFGGDPFAMIESYRGAFIRLETNKTLSAKAWLEFLGDSVFDADNGRGIVPYDTGDGFSFLVAGDDKEDRKRLIDIAKKLT